MRNVQASALPCESELRFLMISFRMLPFPFLLSLKEPKGNFMLPALEISSRVLGIWDLYKNLLLSLYPSIRPADVGSTFSLADTVSAAPVLFSILKRAFDKDQAYSPLGPVFALVAYYPSYRI